MDSLQCIARNPPSLEKLRSKYGYHMAAVSRNLVVWRLWASSARKHARLAAVSRIVGSFTITLRVQIPISGPMEGVHLCCESVADTSRAAGCASSRPRLSLQTGGRILGFAGR